MACTFGRVIGHAGCRTATWRSARAPTGRSRSAATALNSTRSKARSCRWRAVEEAAVFTVPDGEGSSALHAAVVAGRAGIPTERELLAELRNILPPHALPSQIRFVAAMPRTPTGKVDVRALVARQTRPIHLE